jgi:hypothetical protein
MVPLTPGEGPGIWLVAEVAACKPEFRAEMEAMLVLYADPVTVAVATTLVFAMPSTLWLELGADVTVDWALLVAEPTADVTDASAESGDPSALHASPDVTTSMLCHDPVRSVYRYWQAGL